MLKQKDDFKYLGSWADSSEKDIETRKALAWIVHQSHVRSMEIQHEYRAQKEILCNHSRVHTTLRMWSTNDTNKDMEKALDGTYTRMFRKALNVHWSDRVTNESLYGKLPQLSDKIAARRPRLARHCQRHQELGAHRLIR